MNNNIVLIGGAGAPNYGDELIVKGWISFLKENLPKSKITFYENIAHNETKLHGSHENITFKDDLVKVAKSFLGISFWDQVLRGYNFIDNGGIEKYKAFELKPLLEADIIHLHGGGYLNNYDPEKGFYIGLLASLKEKYGKKIFATGIGFGPNPEPKKEQLKELDLVFSKYDFFELRDNENFRWLSNTFPTSCFINGLDDCYLLNASDIADIDNSKKRLFLSFLSYNIKNINNSYWQSLYEYSKQFDEVIFFESYPWEDKEVYEFIREIIPNVHKLDIEESINDKLKISPMDRVICARFHVHFILSRCGAHGLYSKDSKYYNIKHQSIIDRGSSFRFTDFGSFFAPKEIESKSYISLQENNYHNQKIKLCEAIYLQGEPTNV